MMAKKQSTKQVVFLSPEQRLFFQDVIARLTYLIEQERLDSLAEQDNVERLSKRE